jgi:curved DNA-binding protein CbpA
MKRSYYEVLDLKPDVSQEEIQRVYRSLALRYHPDRNPAPDAVVRMTSINEAYEVLGDPHRRREYDALAAKTPSGRNLAAPILSAAREAVLRSGWSVIQQNQVSVLLESNGRRLRVVFMDRLNNATLGRICRQYTDRTVVLAVHIEPPINLGLQTTVIDLMHSGEPALQSLLATFL